MKPVAHRLFSFVVGFLCLCLCFALLPVSVFAQTDSSSASVTDTNVTDTEAGGSLSTDSDTPADTNDSDRIQAAYTFDDPDDLTADVGQTYPLSTKQFGASLLTSTEGRRNEGMTGFVSMDSALFRSVEQFTLGFWTRFTKSQAESKSTLFLTRSSGGESLELKFSSASGTVDLVLQVSDGTRTVTCSYDVTELLTDSSSWLHFAFTYRKSGTASLLTLYVNGKTAASSMSAQFVDISAMNPSSVAFQGVVVDDLYFTNVILEPLKISSMMNQSVASFYRSEAAGQSDVIIPVNPDDPVEHHKYNWAAYLFEGTFASGTDYHSGDIPASVSDSCARIDSSRLSSKFGMAIIRREGTAPAAYLSLDEKLFCGQSAFTFACWIYRDGTTTANDECLLDLNGNGTIRFAPYAVEEDGTAAAYVEFTDSRGNTQHKIIRDGNPANPRNQWVHYALTVSSSGDITVYVNGNFVETFSSGVNPAGLLLSDCRVITGVSSSDGARTAVDEVYVCPKALSAAEIRKIHYYGLARYTSEVLADPGQLSTGSDGEDNPYKPDSVDIAEDAYTATGTILSGFVGTTFDDRALMGQDWNNGANATITGGRLTQGISSYGLSLDGTSSFVRYPIGILDGAESLTISLSYSWSGATSATQRSQRIFDFSRKSSSVADPVAYIYLETGTGISGLRLGLSDGMTSTYISCDYNAVDTWTRVTVTVSDGLVTIYLNDSVAATGYTDVDIASICPNFCYIGRSGVKGDPLFKGAVDEIYISSKALSPNEVGTFLGGISNAIHGTGGEGSDFWGLLIRIVIIAAILLVVIVIAVIVIIITKKDKRTPEEEPELPYGVTLEPEPEKPLGPRSARRARAAAEGSTEDGTVKFRKVSEDAAPVSDDATVKFRKVNEDGGSAPQPPEATTKFQKISDDSTDSF